jgi:hypothetical protein
MSWILDGQKIKASYLGTAVTGRVVSSRVKYGGNVQYSVELDEPVQLPWRSEPTSFLLVDKNEVIEVIG